MKYLGNLCLKPFFHIRFFELNKMHEQGSNSGDHLVGGAPVRKGKGGERKHVLLSHKMEYNNFVYFFILETPILGSRTVMRKETLKALEHRREEARSFDPLPTK